MSEVIKLTPEQMTMLSMGLARTRSKLFQDISEIADSMNYTNLIDKTEELRVLSELVQLLSKRNQTFITP